MIRRISCILALSVIVLASTAVCGEGPHGGAWLECMRECDRDVALCYQDCDVLDDDCWDYCWTRYWICLMSCGDIPDSIGERSAPQ